MFFSFFLSFLLFLGSAVWVWSVSTFNLQGQDTGPKKNGDDDDDDDGDDNPTHRNQEEDEANSQDGTVGRSVC